MNHNSRRFRDVEHKKTDTSSIVFLEDSFTWGYDIEAEERYTDLLRDSLGLLKIYNLGVSGYGTDQEFILLQQQFDFYKPEIVLSCFVLTMTVWITA